MIFPWPASGAGADFLTRTLGEVAGKLLGRAVVVDHRPGGSATLAPAAMAATAKPVG